MVLYFALKVHNIVQNQVFGYNINSLKLEIEGFEKLVKTFNKKNKNSKRERVELEVIEESLHSRIESLQIVNNTEINSQKRLEGKAAISKQELRLAKCALSYSNSFLNLKNYLLCKIELFKLIKNSLFFKKNSIIALIVLLLFLFPWLLISLILILLKFLFRKKNKSRRKKRKKQDLNAINNNELDEKLFDIIDRCAKNRKDIKAIIDLIKGKISPTELEETLKKLKKDPVFKDLINEFDKNFLKELSGLLEKEINDFKYSNPELYMEMKNGKEGKSNFLSALKDLLPPVLTQKIKNKSGKNKKALIALLNNDIITTKIKIKRFKDKNKNLAVLLETHKEYKIKKNKNKNKNKNKVNVKVKKYKKNKNKLTKDFERIDEIIFGNMAVQQSKKSKKKKKNKNQAVFMNLDSLNKAFDGISNQKSSKTQQLRNSRKMRSLNKNLGRVGISI